MRTCKINNGFSRYRTDSIKKRLEHAENDLNRGPTELFRDGAESELLVYASLSEERDIKELSSFYLRISTVSSLLLGLSLFFEASGVQDQAGTDNGSFNVFNFGVFISLGLFIWSNRRKWIEGLFVSGCLFFALGVLRITSGMVLGGSSAAFITAEIVIFFTCMLNGYSSLQLKEALVPQTLLLSRKER